MPRMRKLPTPVHGPNYSRAMPHILSTSATMLGVCMTVLSLSRLDDDQISFWLVDKIVAVAGLLFLTSCLCSFLSMRQLNKTVSVSIASRFERLAESIFMTGISLLALVAVTLAFIVK